MSVRNQNRSCNTAPVAWAGVVEADTDAALGNAGCCRIPRNHRGITKSHGRKRRRPNLKYARRKPLSSQAPGSAPGRLQRQGVCPERRAMVCSGQQLPALPGYLARGYRHSHLSLLCLELTIPWLRSRSAYRASFLYYLITCSRLTLQSSWPSVGAGCPAAPPGIQ